VEDSIRFFPRVAATLLMATDMRSSPVYASVDAVKVPNGIAPGQHFTAYVWATSKGKRVRKLKHFWRASGNVPRNNAADVTIAQGPRHAQRPSAIAKRVSGAGAQAIDHL